MGFTVYAFHATLITNQTTALYIILLSYLSQHLVAYTDISKVTSNSGMPIYILFPISPSFFLGQCTF